MCRAGLLRVHVGDCFTRVHQLAAPPPVLDLAWACGATSASGAVMARIAIRHPASCGSGMAPRTPADAKGSPSNPGDCARPAGLDSAHALDNCRLHIFVAQELLHRPDIIALLEQMRCKAMPQSVTTDAFGEPCRTTGSAYGPLQPTLMGVMAADDPRARVFRQPVGGKDILPDPEPAGMWILACQRKRSIDRGDPVCDILRMEALDL
jgi:hypothetical protein